MTALKNCIFSTNGCWIDIDGNRFNISTKFGILRWAAVNVAPDSPADTEAAEELMDQPVGEDSWACGDPRLVELSIRYAAWLDDNKAAPWADTPAEPLPEREAMDTIGFWLAKQPAD